MPIGRPRRVKLGTGERLVDNAHQADLAWRRGIIAAPDDDLVAVQVITLHFNADFITCVELEGRPFAHLRKCRMVASVCRSTAGDGGTRTLRPWLR